MKDEHWENIALRPLPGERPAETKRRSEEADIAHAFHRDGLKAFLPTVISFGTEALKVTMVLNGTAAAAVLAFIGAGRQDVTSGLISAFGAFCVGLTFGALAHPAAYIAQYAYHRESESRQHALEFPYVRETDGSKEWSKWAVRIHKVCVALVGASFLSATAGFYLATSSLRPMAASQRPPDMSTTTPGSR